MRRISRAAAAVVAAAASVCSTAQVLTAPLSASPRVRLTDSCSATQNTTVQLEGSPALTEQLASIANDPGADPAVLRSLWWPRGATTLDIGSAGFAFLDYDPFQDNVQIAADITATMSKTVFGVQQGVTAAGGSAVLCFDPTPPPPIYPVAEYRNPLNGEYRLAVREGEAASLAADGWTATGDAFHVVGLDPCNPGHVVFRFVHAQDGPRAGNLLTMDPAECGSIRKSNPAWRPLDVPFQSVPPVNGACTGQLSGVAVYRIAFPRAPMAPTLYRFTSNKPLYDELLAQGWTGRGIAFCAMS